VDSDPVRPEPSLAEPTTVHELRRDYHDRIAELRATSIAIVRDAARATEDATHALLDRDTTAERLIVADAAHAANRVAEVEAAVFALLALQAPVARDLRLILASRDIVEIGGLCLGLCRALATRGRTVQDVLAGGLRSLVEVIGDHTVRLLGQANAAWTVLDPDLAEAVVTGAAESREVQRQFLAALLGLRHVPVDAAVDLGMAVRVYERLTDHAVEIAGRVLFVVRGALPSPAAAEPDV
jgi:phosphate transport system protein